MKWYLLITLLGGSLSAAIEDPWITQLRSAEDAHDLGQYAQAETILNNTLDELGRNSKRGMPWAVVTHALANLYKSEVKWDEAVTLYGELIDFWTKEAGPTSIGLGQVLVDLAELRIYQQRFRDGEELLIKARDTFEKGAGGDSAALGSALNGLGNMYLEQGRWEDARKVLDRAITILRKYPDRREYAVCLLLVGNLHMFTSKYAEAKPYFEEALSIARGWGEKTPAFADALTSLAILYRAEEDFVRAEPLLTKARAIYESTNIQSPRLAKVLLEQGHIALNEKKFSTAKNIYERAADMARATLGSDHLIVAVAQNHMALACYAEGDVAVARDLLQKAIATTQKTQFQSLGLSALFHLNLGRVEAASNHPQEADVHLQKAAELYETELGPSHPMVGKVLMLRAQYLKKTNKAEAQKIEARARYLLAHQ
jgi:tetratricopeptide (TPR) repeat protein